MKRRLALSEARYAYFFAIFFISLFNCLAKFFTVHGNLELIPVCINLFCFFQAHFYTSVK